MKVAFLLESFSQGGSERQMIRLAEGLHKRGYEIKIIVYHKGNFYQVEGALSECVRIIDTTSRIGRILSIRRELKLFKADVLISYVRYATFYSLLASTGLRNCKNIISWRNYNPNFFDDWYSRFLKLYRNKIIGIVCNSRNGFDTWKEHCPKDTDKLHVIYNLIPQLKNNTNYRYQTPSLKRIIVPARLHRIKNPDKLVEAFSRLSAEEKDALRIDWYGADGNDKEYCDDVRSLVVEHGLSDYIHFLPASNDIYAEISRSDIVGLFSESEGFPNAICEGMMLGKAILMTKVSDYSDMVSDNGYCCDATVDEIELGLKWAANLICEDLNNLGINSKQKADVLFNYDKELQKWVDLIMCGKENG